MREPIDNLALSNTVRPGIVGLVEVARARARPEGDHRQLHRSRAASTPIGSARSIRTGPTEADLATIPLRRLGTTREVGDVAAFLCSERASYVSGTVILVDGALTRGLW